MQLMVRRLADDIERLEAEVHVFSRTANGAEVTIALRRILTTSEGGGDDQRCRERPRAAENDDHEWWSERGLH